MPSFGHPFDRAFLRMRGIGLIPPAASVVPTDTRFNCAVASISPAGLIGWRIVCVVQG